MLLKNKLKLNLMLLTILVMTSWKSFSQNDTKNDSLIQLTKPVAKLVVQDLIKYDGLTLEVKSLEELLNQNEFKINTQTSLIVNLESQIGNFESVIKNLNKKYDTSQKLSEDLEKALRKQKRQARLYKIGSGVGAVAILLLLVQ